MPDVLTEDEAQEIEDALNTPVDQEAETLKELETEVGKAFDASQKNLVTATLRLLGGLADGAVKSLAKRLVGEDERKKADEKVELPSEVVALAKAGDYEAVMKAASASPALMGVMVELLKARDTEVAGLKKSLDAILAKSDDDEVTTLVKDAGLPGMATEDQVKLVKSLNSEQRTAWFNHAKALRANLSLGEERGSVRRGEDTYNPLEEVNKRVQELVVKSGGSIGEGEAQYQVLQSDPKLAADYKAYVRGEKV